jgi:hypothetical protein
VYVHLHLGADPDERLNQGCSPDEAF